MHEPFITGLAHFGCWLKLVWQATHIFLQIGMHAMSGKLDLEKQPISYPPPPSSPLPPS